MLVTTIEVWPVFETVTVCPAPYPPFGMLVWKLVPVMEMVVLEVFMPQFGVIAVTVIGWVVIAKQLFSVTAAAPLGGVTLTFHGLAKPHPWPVMLKVQVIVVELTTTTFVATMPAPPVPPWKGRVCVSVTAPIVGPPGPGGTKKPVPVIWTLTGPVFGAWFWPVVGPEVATMPVTVGVG